MDEVLHTHNPLICAIDTTDVAFAHHLCSEVKPYVGAVKLGLEFYTAHGIHGINNIACNDIPVFLDLKFHDIPHTVYKAILATVHLNTLMMTVHVAGGVEMLQGAMEASMELAEITGKERPMIIGVTVLTSLTQNHMHMYGDKVKLHDQVKRFADIAQSSGLDGVVCSPLEIELIREECGRDFLLIVPGIRPTGIKTDDQQRIMDPKSALYKGADYLVVGRPITKAENPAQVASNFLL